MMKTMIRETRSVCPVCLKNLPAVLTRQDSGQIRLEKTCPDHGFFEVPVWQERMDFDKWLLETEPLSENCGLDCPGNCGICKEHEIGQLGHCGRHRHDVGDDLPWMRPAWLYACLGVSSYLLDALPVQLL